MGKKQAIICDIDNCFTDSREWLKECPQGSDREAWDIFQDKIYLAKPNKPIIGFLTHAVNSFNIPIIFITGREDRRNHREKTIKQIESFSEGSLKVGVNSGLFMRSEFDYRPAPEIKAEILDKLSGTHDFIFAIDDEESNCDLYRSRGIPAILYNIEIEEETKECA